MELNQFSTVDIVLDKANDNIIQKQTISAGDRDGRSLTAQVTNAGSIGEVPGLTANLLWTNHSSGVSDLSAFSVVDRTTSVFKIEYPQNMLTPGKVTAQIQLLYGDKVTHSKKFEIIVLDIAGSLKGVLQTAEYTALVEALAKTNGFEGDIAELEMKKADLSYVADKFGRLSKLSPSGTYASYIDLKQAHPNGNTNIYLTADNGHWYYWSGNDWTSGGVFATGENFALLQPGKNLFDKSKAIIGMYALYSNGRLDYSANHVVTDFIKVEPHEFYVKNDIQQLAFYTGPSQGSYLSGIDTATIFKVPENGYYVRITINLENVDTFQLEKGLENTEYEPFGYYLKEHQLEPSLLKKIESLDTPSSVLTVAKNSGIFDTVGAASNSIKLSQQRQTIILYPGIYKEVVDLRSNQFVDIVSLNKETTRILDSTGDYDNSPLNISGNGYFKNLTFVASHDDLVGPLPDKKSYAVHIDHPGSGGLIFEDCNFMSYQNSAVGIGMHQSQTVIFKRCTLYSDSDYGACMYAHNNVTSGVKNQLLIFEDCKFISEKGDSLRLDDSNIIFDDGLGNDMTVKFINNYFYSKEKGKGTLSVSHAPIGTGTICGRIKLDQSSSGNNIPELNATASDVALKQLLADYNSGALGGANAISFEQN